MESAIFLLVTTLVLSIALFLLRPRSRKDGLGFALCCSLYIVFLAGFFLATAAVVISTWLALSVANMAIQYRALQSQGDPQVTPAVLFSSLFLWPIQFAGLRIHQNDEVALSRSRSQSRQRIGVLPATVSGTVSYAHHISSEDGEELVWLEEYEDLEFWATSELYDAIGIAEGLRVSLTVEERELQARSDDDRMVLWIVDGTVLA